MLRLRNLSCFIVPADVWHAILHLFVMQSACMLAHIILSASLLLPPPPTPFGLLMLKITSRFMTMKDMGARERKTCWLKDSWPYLPPSTASLDHLYSRNFVPDSGNQGEKSQTWGDCPLPILKSFQQWRSRDRLTLRRSRLLSPLWHDQTLLRGFHGWLIGERTPKPKEKFCTFILGPHEVCTRTRTSPTCMVCLCLKAWLTTLPFQTIRTCLQGRKEL